MERLRQIPGPGPRNSEAILAEVGTDMSRFPTDAHFASWAKLCLGNSAADQAASTIVRHVPGLARNTTAG
ncbi:MAG: transposase [Candidatus Dormibacteraceae bacterium]